MDNDNPHQPLSFPRNRRVCPSDLKRTIKALKRQLRKEEKRSAKMKDLRHEIEHLATTLRALKHDQDNP